MSKNTAKARHIDAARTIFTAALASLGSKPYSKEFRQDILESIRNETGVETPSAAAMYNKCKQEAEDRGEILKGRLGRIPQQSVALDPNVGWTGFVERTVEAEEEGAEDTTVQVAVGQGDTKSGLQALMIGALEGGSVVKTATFLSNNPDTPTYDPNAEAEAEGEGEGESES